MRLNSKQLKKMAVETMSGTKLGKIQEVIMDVENQMVVHYEVKHSGISGENYLINRDQVARFEEKKMVVYDSVLKKREKNIIPPIPVVPESGIAMSND